MASVVTLKVEGYRSHYNWSCVISGLTDSARKDFLEKLAPWTVDYTPLYIQEQMGRFGDTFLLIKINQHGAGRAGKEIQSLPDDVVNKLLNILGGMGLKVVGSQQQGPSSYGPTLFIWTLQ